MGGNWIGWWMRWDMRLQVKWNKQFIVVEWNAVAGNTASFIPLIHLIHSFQSFIKQITLQSPRRAACLTLFYCFRSFAALALLSSAIKLKFVDCCWLPLSFHHSICFSFFALLPKQMNGMELNKIKVNHEMKKEN